MEDVRKLDQKSYELVTVPEQAASTPNTPALTPYLVSTTLSPSAPPRNATIATVTELKVNPLHSEGAYSSTATSSSAVQWKGCAKEGKECVHKPVFKSFSRIKSWTQPTTSRFREFALDWDRNADFFWYLIGKNSHAVHPPDLISHARQLVERFKSMKDAKRIPHNKLNFIALLTAIKYNEERVHYTYNYLCRVFTTYQIRQFGITSQKQLCDMEVEFLSTLDWRLSYTPPA